MAEVEGDKGARHIVLAHIGNKQFFTMRLVLVPNKWVIVCTWQKVAKRRPDGLFRLQVYLLQDLSPSLLVLCGSLLPRLC